LNLAGGIAEALADQNQLRDNWKVRIVNTGDPKFYGHARVARKEYIGIGPAQGAD